MNEQKNPWICSCGEKFDTLKELEEHTGTSGGLFHGDKKCPFCGNEEALTVGKVLHPELSLCSDCRQWGDWEK